MALSSQSARPVSRRAHMYRRRRHRGLMRVVLVMAGIVALGWVGLRVLSPGDPSDGDAAGTARGGMVAMRTGEITPAPDEQRPPRVETPPHRPAPATPPQASPRSAPPPDPAPAIANPAPPVTAPAHLEPRDAAGTANSTASATTPQAAPRGPAPTDSRARRRAVQTLESGRERLAENDPVEARRLLSAALASGELTTRETDETRRALAGLNERLVFSPEIVEGDPFAFRYKIASGDTLEKIVRRMGLQVDWRFIQRINRISRPERIRAGDLIKLVTGPFHAVVDKSDYRMDVYLGADDERVYVTSFRVGLGEFDSTPIGRFGVRPDSKLINPVWRNPRTGERYDADDPANPIGERWIGLVGLEEALRDVAGYGIHGTVEPESIGQQASMGCVRMLPDDVAITYELLVERASFIDIVR